MPDTTDIIIVITFLVLFHVLHIYTYVYIYCINEENLWLCVH